MGACLGAEPLACEPELLAPVGGDEIAGFGTWRRAESLDLEARTRCRWLGTQRRGSQRLSAVAESTRGSLRPSVVARDGNGYLRPETRWVFLY